MRNLGRAACAGAAALILAGCWPAPGGGPDRRAHNDAETAITVDTAVDLEQQWLAAIGPVDADPILSGGKLFVRTGDTLYRLQAATGAEVWSASATGFTGPVIADGDRVTTATSRDSFYPVGRWYDTGTGELLGSTSRGYLSSRRAPYEAYLSLEQMWDGPTGTFLRVVDVDEGTTWERFLGGSPTEVTVGDEVLLQVGFGVNVTEPTDDFADIGPGVRAYTLTGPVENCFANVIPCPVWAYALDSDEVFPAVLSRDGSTTFVAEAGGTVHALDLATGDLLWAGSAGLEATASPALADGRLYVPGAEGDVHVYAEEGCDEAICEPLWTAGTDAPGDAVPAQPAVAGTGDSAVLLTVSSLGSVRAYPAAGCGAATCAPVWSADTGPVTTPPVVSNGRVFVGTEAGLVAFGLP